MKTLPSKKKLVSGLLMIVMSLQCGCDSSFDLSRNRRPPNKKTAIDTFDVMTLNSIYNENMLEADVQHSGKYMVLMGVISEVSKKNDSICVTLSQQNYETECYFKDTIKSFMPAKGTYLKIKGICYGKRNTPVDYPSLLNNIKLAHCEVIAQMSKDEFAREAGRFKSFWRFD